MMQPSRRTAAKNLVEQCSDLVLKLLAKLTLEGNSWHSKLAPVSEHFLQS